MSRYSDPDYLRSEQYKDATNLNARIALHRRFSTNPQNFYPWVFDHLRIEPGQRILELGCGSGDLWRDNLDRLPDGCQMILADLSPGMLAQAKVNLAQIKAEIDFANLDAQCIPIRQENFDLVIANFMIYHIPDQLLALAGIQQVLKPGGRLYAATNGREHLREIKQLIQKVSPGRIKEYPAVKFSLENGDALLSRFFPQVRVYRYGDSLQVTEVEPLVAYIDSMDYILDIGRQRKQLAHLIEKQIEERGAFLIRKDSGMFEAVKEN